MNYPSVKAKVDGKSFLAVAVGNVTYLIWTVAEYTSAAITKILPGDVEIGGVKPAQVYDGHNTYIKWSDIPTIAPNPKRDQNGVWLFASKGGPSFLAQNGTINMANQPILDLTTPQIKSRVLVQTNVGGWFFDAILNMNHSSSTTITSHPVQTGNAVSDYAYMEPRKLSMSIGMTDVAKSIIPGQFSGGGSRSVEAWKVLEKLQELRVPIQVTTRLHKYENMLIQSLSTTDDNTTTHGLRATVNFQELLVATVKTVKVSALPSVTSGANKGAKQPQQPPTSILAALSGLLK